MLMNSIINIKAIILAGGRGNRLRPYTKYIPKPMLLVQGKPILEHIINSLKGSGITNIIFSVSYLSQKIKSYFGNGSKFGITINYIDEEPTNQLGTSGAIVKAQDLIRDTFIVTYGDILRSLDISAVIEQHKNTHALATLVIYQNNSSKPKSIIKINKENRILSFRERPRKYSLRRSVWSNASLYIFEPDIFKYIPRDINSDFGKDIFPKIIKDNGRIYAYKSKGYFIDIGDKNKLDKAQKSYKDTSLT